MTNNPESQRTLKPIRYTEEILDRKKCLSEPPADCYLDLPLTENLVRFEEGRQGKAEDYRPKGELIGLGDSDGVGILGGIPIKGRAAAIAKKANEAKYLRDLFQDVPRSLLRGRKRR